MRTKDLLLLFFLSETKDRVSFVSSFSDVASKALSTLIMDVRGTGRYFWPRAVDGHNLIVLASLFHFDTPFIPTYPMTNVANVATSTPYIYN